MSRRKVRHDIFERQIPEAQEEVSSKKEAVREVKKGIYPKKGRATTTAFLYTTYSLDPHYLNNSLIHIHEACDILGEYGESYEIKVGERKAYVRKSNIEVIL